MTNFFNSNQRMLITINVFVLPIIYVHDIFLVGKH